MITATYFGEITELGSRAVWYSDEEDDDDYNEHSEDISKHRLRTVGPLTHETMKSNIQMNFQRICQLSFGQFNSCYISTSSKSQFLNLRFDQNELIIRLLGNFENYGKAFICNCTQSNDSSLWLLFDSSCQYITDQGVGYFAEKVLDILHTEFKLNSNCPISIISQQFTDDDSLEYLNNFEDPTSKVPFTGRRITPPSLIRGQFESALFEQLTLTLKPAFIVCLPNPKNSWFDKSKNWPSIPSQIVELKLSDDNLEKTLIFT